MFIRILVHAEAQPEESDGPIRLQRWEPKPVKVLEMSPPVWWITEPDGTPQPVNPRNVRVCAGLECTVDACTRAESMRAAEAESEAFRLQRDAQIGGLPLNDRERAAVLQLHREDEVRIYNLAYALERFGMKAPAGDPATIMEHVHALVLELKSRREEQGLLRDHPSDSPGSRIRYWMEEHYPGEREAAQQFSEWVISKLNAGRLASGQLDSIIAYLMRAFPSELVSMATNGTAATVNRLLGTLRGALEAAGITMEGTPDSDGHATYLTNVVKEGQLPAGARPVPYDIQVQIDRLATYIMDEVPGEPSQSQGAVDTAIRIMREQRTALDAALRVAGHVGRLRGYLSVQPNVGVITSDYATIDIAIDYIGDLQQQIAMRKEVQSAQLGPIMAAVDRLFGDDIKAVLGGKGWTDVETAIPAILERVAARLPKLDPA